MAYLFLFLKRNLMLTMTILSFILCTSAVILVSKALRIAQDPILIAIDANGTRVIARTDDPIFDTEAVHFSRLLVAKLYNFNPQNFRENVDYASTFFSIPLWQEEEQKFLEHIKAATTEQISMTGSIQKITKNSPTEYTIEAIVHEITRLNTQERHVSLKLVLQRVSRSKINPYGIELSSYEETLVN
jgi:hypothetical protein